MEDNKEQTADIETAGNVTVLDQESDKQTGPATPAPADSLALIRQMPTELAAYAGRIELDPDGKMGLAIIAESENDFPIEAFKGLCKMLNSEEISTPWRIADALNAAEVLYGNNASQFQDAATFLGYTATTLTQICFTAANVQPKYRREELSIWFHRKVAKLKPHEQAKLLREAIKCPKSEAEALGCKPGATMTLKQLEQHVKNFKAGPGAGGKEEGEGAGEGTTRPSEFAPKDEGGQPFVWRFRAREAREPLQDYINEERKAHAIAFQCHYDPQFKAQKEQEAVTAAEKEKRAADRVKLVNAVATLPESERKGYLTTFDGGAEYATVKASIGARKDALKKETAGTTTASPAKSEGSKKGGSKKSTAKKSEPLKGEQPNLPATATTNAAN
jgi:hypothetical protein